MKTVFVSCERIDEPVVIELIKKLKKFFVVLHSPRNPLDGEDFKWNDWYQTGLNGALAKSDIFLIAVTNGWDSATWMAIESHEALRLFKNSQICKTVFWNPLNIKLQSSGTAEMYLREQILGNIDEVIEKLKQYE